MRNAQEGHDGRLAHVGRPEYEALRAVLTEAMGREGIGQRELARRMDRPEVIVNRILKLRRSIDFADLLDMCDAIGISPVNVVAEALRRARGGTDEQPG